jgi:hypothetical protein
MARIDWTTPGHRFFEAGVDRGVLYVAGNPGVPWVGLVGVKHSASGGEAKPRYLDGVKISNHAEPEEFEGSIEAFTYPTEFAVCDGTVRLQNGLRAGQQRRRPFSMTYRTKVGNEIDGLDHAYKIHFLYNLSAVPSERDYQSLGEENDPLSFNWDFTSRGEMVIGIRPTAHFEVDTRDIPASLLQLLEDMLYGSVDNAAHLPTAGELIFLFDSFEDLVYDAGTPYTSVFQTFDAGTPDTPVTTTIDGGAL